LPTHHTHTHTPHTTHKHTTHHTPHTHTHTHQFSVGGRDRGEVGEDVEVGAVAPPPLALNSEPYP